MPLANSTNDYSSPPKNLLTVNETSSTNPSVELLPSNNQILDKSPEISPQQAEIDAFILNQDSPPTTNSIPEKTQTSTTQTDAITGDTTKPATHNNISFDSGIFQAYETGKIVFDYLSDGGLYQGELAIISLTGMQEFVPDSQAFIKEAARRALSNSSLGYIAISDSTEAAKFSSFEGENNFNIGEYRGIKTFAMTPGDEIGIILVPNGTIQEAYNNPALGGDKKPLFSMATTNSSDAFQRGQIASVANGGSIFVMEDMGRGEGSDADYNDIIFSLKGATPKVISMDDVIAKNSDWRTSEKGKELIADAAPKTETKLEDKKADTTSATNPVETKPENSPATETKNPTVSENPNSDPNSAETKTENSSATETENPTISEIPNSDPNPVEIKTENSSATETENPTISEIPNSDPNSAETKTDSPAVETKNPTVSEIPNSDPNSTETKTDSPAVETKNPTVSEIPNSDPNSTEIKTENSSATETENPTISENPNSDPNPVEIKTENSSATETENPTISEIPNSDPNSAETKTDSPAVETKNPTVSEIPNSDPNSTETKTDSPAVETKNPTVSESANSATDAAEAKTETSPAVETKNPTVSESANSVTDAAEAKTETSPAVETKNPTVSESANSVTDAAEAKTETSPAVETKNPTVSENSNSLTDLTETKTETSLTAETKNSTVSEISNSATNSVETQTEKSPAVEADNPTVSEISNAVTNSVETKTETSPAGETQNPIVAENPNWATNPADSEIDAITGDKIETRVFLQPEKSETPTTPAAAADILTGEIENISPTPTDSLATASESNETFGPLSDEEIALLWENLNRIWAAAELSENSETSELEYINANEDTDSNNPTRLPFTPISQNYLPTDIENTADFELINGGDGEAETSESAQTAIISETATPTPANNQPETSQTTIPASASNSETNNNEYTVAQTDSFTETTADSPQPTKPLIGIIDTGFTANNPNINYSQIILGKDVIDGDSNPLIQPNTGNQHGDAILEIISDSHNRSDTQKSSEIWLGRATGSGNWHQSLIEFVNAAIAAKQPNAVVNLSFDLTQINPDGGQTTRHKLTAAETAALQYAKDNNILIVAAAGNEGNLISALGQASTEFDNIITVGASQNNYRAAYSSYGNGLDILAPTSTPPTAETATTETKQGTSIAAAKVTNTISQMWAANPSLNYQQIKNILLNTAKDIDVPSWDERTGYGILDAGSAIATAAETIPTIPVLVAAKYLTKSLIDADVNISNSPNSTATKTSERATATTAPGTPKVTSTSTGDSNNGTSSYTADLAPYQTTSSSSANGTTSTNSRTLSSLSNTESSWDRSTTKTNHKGESFDSSTSDSATNASTHTSKSFSQNSTERKNQWQENRSRVKHEGTRADTSESAQKSRSSYDYTTPTHTRKDASDSYRNSKSKSNSQYATNLSIAKGDRQDDWGSKSTSNSRTTSGNNISTSKSATQTAGNADWTNSSNGSSYNNTHTGEETTVSTSNSTNSNSSGFSKNSSGNDNYSVTNSTWENTTINGVAINSNTRDVYSEGSTNNQSSYDDGKSKNHSNRDTYTVNKSEQTNSSQGSSYRQNNRHNNYSVTQGNDTQTYKHGPQTSSRITDNYSVTKSDGYSANSSGKITSKNNQETYSENRIKHESEYKIDAYTTTTTGDEETITSTRSTSNNDGTNNTSSSSSDTVRTRNDQTVTVHKDGRKNKNEGSSYQRWWNETATDRGVTATTNGYESWSSSYSRSEFKGGYSWSETISGTNSESVTKGGTTTSKQSNWSWTRSGTVWDDGRNNWSESWSKSNWENGRSVPGESETARGSYDPKGTGTLPNNLPEAGEAPRLNKVPKNRPIDLNKPPKPTDNIWQTPPRTRPRVVENVPDNWFAGSGGGGNPGSGKLPPNKISALAKVIRELLSFFRALGEFVAGAIYQWLRNNGELARWLLQVLSPQWNGLEQDVERNLPKSWAFQSGRTFGDAASIVTGILEIIGGGGTGAGGAGLCVTGVGCIAGAPAIVAGTALGLHGATTASTGLKNIAKLLGVVFHSTTDGSESAGPRRGENEIHPDAAELEADAKRISDELFGKDTKTADLTVIAVGRVIPVKGGEPRKVVSSSAGYFTDKQRKLLESQGYIVIPDNRPLKNIHAEERMIYWADAEKAKGTIVGIESIGVSHKNGICEYFCKSLMQERGIRPGSRWNPTYKPGPSRQNEPPRR
ncbi:DUF4114 domain-containing protein [Microcoleus sp. B7-D4]|uniref:DUF4114 domain-containing protein n=1 Tax=Microcoleus sp. B7-D4 TaxID=2818696 RepID=UPI002FD0F6F9